MGDRTVRLVLSGSSAGALRALEEVGLKAETTAAKTEAAFGDRLAGKVQSSGGALQKIGNMLGSFGLPFSESVSKMGEKVGDAETKGKSLGGTLASVGKAAALAGVAGFAVVAAESLKLGENFQQSTAALAANAGIPIATAKKIGDAFLSTAGQSTFSGQQMMSAYAPVAAQLASVQGRILGAADASKVMKAASDLAEASGGNLGTTTAALAATMQAYGLKAGDAARASDTLYNVSRLTNTPIDQLTSVVDRLKGRLGTLAPTLQDVGTLMAFPQIASQGSRGAMLVNTALQTLLGGTKQTRAELKTLGVNLYDSSGKFVGMRDVIAQLQPKLAGMTDAQKQAAEKTLFGAGAAQLMGQVVAGGLGAYDKAAVAVGKTGTAQAAAEKQSSTFHGTMEKLKATGEDLGAKFGIMLIPVISKLGAIVAKTVNWLEKHKAVAEALAAVVGGVLLVAIAAWVVSMAAAAVATIAATWPILAIIAAVAAIGVGIYELVTHWSEVWGFIKKIADDVWKFLKRIFEDGVKFVKAHWKDMVEVLLIIMTGGMATIPVLIFRYWSQITQFTAQLWRDVTGFVERIWHDVARFFTNMWTDVTGGVSAGAATVVGFFTALPGRFMSALGNIWNTIKQPFVDLITHVRTDIVDPAVSYFTALPGRFLSGLGNIWNAVKNAFLAVVQHVHDDITEPVVSYFASLPGRFVSGLGNIWHAIASTFLDIVDHVNNDVIQPIITYFENLPGTLAADASGMWDWILNGLKAIVDDVAGIWNSTVGSLSFTIPSWVPGLGGDGFSMPKIPVLDTGGVVTGPTMAMLSANSVPEIVSPVPQLRALIAEALGSGGGGQAAQLVLDGRVLGQVIWPHVRSAALAGTGRNSVKIGLG